MTRWLSYLFNIWPCTAEKNAQVGSKCSQSRIKIRPKEDQNIAKHAKIFAQRLFTLYAKGAIFRQIWSHCWHKLHNEHRKKERKDVKNQYWEVRDSGCDSVGREVDSDTRGPQFECSYRQILYWTLFSVNCIEQTRIKKKRPGMAHFLEEENLEKLVFLGSETERRGDSPHSRLDEMHSTFTDECRRWPGAQNLHTSASMSSHRILQHSQCDRIGPFLTDLGNKHFLTKVGQIFWCLLGPFWKMALLNLKIAAPIFWATVGKIWLLFIPTSGHTVCSTGANTTQIRFSLKNVINVIVKSLFCLFKSVPSLYLSIALWHRN